jgi:hypothetical protein
MTKAAANTGIMPIALVAVEQYFGKSLRIVDDGLAAQMLPIGAKLFVHLLSVRWIRDWLIDWSEKSGPGIWGGLLCRKRYVYEKSQLREVKWRP